MGCYMAYAHERGRWVWECGVLVHVARVKRSVVVATVIASLIAWNRSPRSGGQCSSCKGKNVLTPIELLFSLCPGGRKFLNVPVEE
jgi:hypothetical protein